MDREGIYAHVGLSVVEDLAQMSFCGEVVSG